MDMESEATAAFLEPARREAMGTSRHNACQPTALMQRLHPVTGARGLAPREGEAGPASVTGGHELDGVQTIAVEVEQGHRQDPGTCVDRPGPEELHAGRGRSVLLETVRDAPVAHLGTERRIHLTGPERTRVEGSRHELPEWRQPGEP